MSIFPDENSQMLNLFKHACRKVGPHLFMCSLKKHLELSTKEAVVVMSLTAQPVDARGVTAIVSFRLIWFLDKGDANSTSNLLRHAKNCWGSEAVEAAAATSGRNDPG